MKTKVIKLFDITPAKDKSSCAACNCHDLDSTHRTYKAAQYYDMRFGNSNMVLHFCEDCLIILNGVIGKELIAQDNIIEVEGY